MAVGGLLAWMVFRGIHEFFLTMAKNVADRAIQSMGGYGYVGEYNVERLWRDSKLLEIGGGTNEAHHKNMVRDLSRHVDKLPWANFLPELASLEDISGAF